MRRDGLTRKEATEQLRECKEAIADLINNSGEINFPTYDEVADVVADYLGLEPDYLDVILNEF